MSGHSVWRLLGDGRVWVAKVGPAEKIRAEVEQTHRWKPLLDGAVRQVRATLQRGPTGALLGEYLPGRPLAQLLEEGDLSGTSALAEVMDEIWGKSYRPQPEPSVYTRDIRERLELLVDAYPEFADYRQWKVAGAEMDHRYGDLLDELAACEDRIAPRYAVFIHGDLTPHNVLFDPGSNRVEFLDLARAGLGDPVLDVGKFIAALVREGWADPHPRRDRGADPLVQRVLSCGRAWSDDFVELRLEISCARTLVGSARLMPAPRARWQLEEGFARLARALHPTSGV